MFQQRLIDFLHPIIACGNSISLHGIPEAIRAPRLTKVGEFFDCTITVTGDIACNNLCCYPACIICKLYLSTGEIQVVDRPDRKADNKIYPSYNGQNPYGFQ